MQRVTGIGGIFFKAKDPASLGAWYRDHLGLDVTDWGGAIFKWGGPESLPRCRFAARLIQVLTFMEKVDGHPEQWRDRN